MDGLCIKSPKNKNYTSYIGDVDFNALNAGSGEYYRMEIFESIGLSTLYFSISSLSLKYILLQTSKGVKDIENRIDVIRKRTLGFYHLNEN